jgi:hypothetical protein
LLRPAIAPRSSWESPVVGHLVSGLPQDNELVATNKHEVDGGQELLFIETDPGTTLTLRAKRM